MTIMTQTEKAKIFRALHQGPGAFLLPNPWDIGTARLLAALGYQALATTSAGHAFSMGQQDNTLSRDTVMEHVAAIVSATGLPVSVDLGNGFGDGPEEVAQTIRLVAAAGAVGGSIEDATGRPDEPIYQEELAIERIRSASKTAQALPFPFTLTARCENFLVGVTDLDATIRRLQAYEQAGADVLYAPGLTTRADIAAVVGSLTRPVNVLMGLEGSRLTQLELSEIGVKRISTGSALSRVALGAFLRAAREMHDHGTFTFADQAASSREITALFSRS
jgi:2-methylisocitrate lyase-like PEP mutase family enzyme